MRPQLDALQAAHDLIRAPPGSMSGFVTSTAMASSALRSPIVLDGIVSDEKLAELLAFQAEYPELDYKSVIDLTTTEGKVELAKDVGAMQVRGGYIIGGADNHGALTGQLDGLDARPFDEANLAPRLLRWLPDPLELRTRVAARESHAVVVIFVGRHPSGCAFFRADGTYTKKGAEVVAFRAGDIFWRDGTRSVRVTQQGLEEIIERRIANAKSGWVKEQQELRQHERADLNAAYEGRRLTQAPLGTVGPDLEASALTIATLELLRQGDTIALRHLLNEAIGRARTQIQRDDVEAELAELLDKLTCLAATFIEYEQDEWLARVISALAQIYSMPLGEGDALRFGYSPQIDPGEKAPRVWLLVIQRVFGLGALAVRRGNWKAVRALTLKRPERLSDYDANWLRHALTMASRAHHLQEQRADGQTLELSLLSLARTDVARLDCLRPDGLAADDDEIITSPRPVRCALERRRHRRRRQHRRAHLLHQLRAIPTSPDPAERRATADGLRDAPGDLHTRRRRPRAGPRDDRGASAAGGLAVRRLRNMGAHARRPFHRPAPAASGRVKRSKAAAVTLLCLRRSTRAALRPVPQFDQ